MWEALGGHVTDENSYCFTKAIDWPLIWPQRHKISAIWAAEGYWEMVERVPTSLNIWLLNENDFMYSASNVVFCHEVIWSEMLQEDPVKMKGHSRFIVVVLWVYRYNI